MRNYPPALRMHRNLELPLAAELKIWRVPRRIALIPLTKSEGIGLVVTVVIALILMVAGWWTVTAFQ